MFNQSSTAWAILLAAGRGRRLCDASGGVPKQFLEWRGLPLYWHSVLTISRCAFIEGIVLVLPTEFLETAKQRNLPDPGLPIVFVAGGPERQDSVRNGLAAVPLTARRIVVHDAARPFASPSLFWRVNEALRDGVGGAVPGLPVTDTIKIATNGIVEGTPAREALFAVQTPQAFFASALRRAHLEGTGRAATDDASLLETCNIPVALVPGEESNIKITRPSDLRLLESGQQLAPCNGIGYDVHRFGGVRPLRIGGVEVPGPGLLAHSDGDVLLHALADAILGCAGLGDLGMHFPDSDPAYEGISSAILIDNVLELARKAGVSICHADLIVVAQRPRFAPYAAEIAHNIARLLQLPRDRVNFKATTEERLGFTGREEGIKALAMVSAMRRFS